MFKKLIFLVVLVSLNVPVFAQSVDTAWVRKYNGTADYSSDDAIAVDNSGNVYVICTVDNIGTGSDYATIKYYPNGDTAWVRRYNGTGDSTDIAEAIGVDDSGNVYVTGYSWGEGTDLDFATIKYYPNGDTAWVRRYHRVKSDGAHDLAIDNSGNIYVTGSSDQNVDYPYNSDCVTIKYLSNGDTAWTRRYNEASEASQIGIAIAIDDFNNVYVAGEGFGYLSSGYIIIKYYSDGDFAWVRFYWGIGSSFNWLTAIATDNSGNIYVSGISQGMMGINYFATIKYYPDGDTAWVRRSEEPVTGWIIFHRFPAIAVDDSGNICVAGTSEGYFTTIKYSTTGETAWVRKYQGGVAQGIASDGSTNIYVTGKNAYEDYLTIKYYPNGETAWISPYSGPANSRDEARSLALDGSGNVYITGVSSQNSTYTDIVTIKYVQFLRGDTNDDGDVTLSDIVYLISYLFKFGPAPAPIQSGDTNCDGQVTLSDIVYLINYLFKQGAPPCI